MHLHSHFGYSDNTGTYYFQCIRAHKVTPRSQIFGKDRPDKDAEVVFLTKFIVTPDIALDFIAEIKKVSTVCMLCFSVKCI